MAATQPGHGITVREGLPSDLWDLVAADEYARAHPERAEFIRESIAQGECLIAESGGQVAGFIVLNYSFFGFGFIPLVVVTAGLRRRGIALRLLGEVQVRCTSRKLFASASSSNTAAQALFARAGFDRSGFIENLDEEGPEIVFFKGSGEA